MNRLFTITAAIVAVVLFSSSKPLKMACIGDSITYGACIEDRENDCYPNVLQGMMGNGYIVKNFGFSARVMLQKGDYPYMKEKMYSEVKEFLPDIVTIMLGTNDSKPWNWEYKDDFEGDYLRMIDEMRNLPTHPRIYLCLPPWVAKDSFGINDSTVVAGVIPVVRKLGDRRWLDVIDTYSCLKGQPDKYVADGVHPNASGAKILAETIFEALQRNGDTGKHGKRVVFIGDSITDGDWAKADAKFSQQRNHYDMNHIYGHGYQSMCATYLLEKYPERRYSFFNRGKSGDRLKGLESRWQTDVLDIHPDVVSILVGINDTGGKTIDTFDFADWEQTYRSILDRTLEADPDTRFVLCTPFVADLGAISHHPDFEGRKAAVHKLASIVRKLASDYNAVLVPYDELIAGLISTDKSGNEKYWTWDGVHPTYPAHSRMADLWIKSTRKLFR